MNERDYHREKRALFLGSLINEAIISVDHASIVANDSQLIVDLVNINELLMKLKKRYPNDIG